MDPLQLSTALQVEYYHLQKTIEDFDGKAMTIKAWSVTFSLSVLVGAFVSQASAVLLIAAAASVLFWFLETMWKVFQLGFYERAEQIEAHFRGESKLNSPNQIGAAWMEKWNRTPWSEVCRMALWPHVALPHIAVTFIGAAMFLLAKFGALAL